MDIRFEGTQINGENVQDVLFYIQKFDARIYQGLWQYS